MGYNLTENGARIGVSLIRQALDAQAQGKPLIFEPEHWGVTTLQGAALRMRECLTSVAVFPSAAGGDSYIEELATEKLWMVSTKPKTREIHLTIKDVAKTPEGRVGAQATIPGMDCSELQPYQFMTKAMTYFQDSTQKLVCRGFQQWLKEDIEAWVADFAVVERYAMDENGIGVCVLAPKGPEFKKDTRERRSIFDAFKPPPDLTK